ncbi:MAG: hypothetical protein V8T65_17610 [Roseburia inulinivorans]
MEAIEKEEKITADMRALVKKQIVARIFDIRKNSRKLFEGLGWLAHSELCSKWMNQCPTVSV